MDNLFNDILANVSGELTLYSALVTILVGLLFGVAISFTYYKTRNETIYQSSMAITLLMFPVILAIIIMCIGSNVARAFSLAGTLSIIRFRSTTGDAEDIGFIFLDMAAGLACGVGLYGYGAVFVLIMRLFINLISNAYQYTDDGGTIIVSLSGDDKQIVFSVEDNGIGISQKDITEIWERFYQVDVSRNDKDGSGIGIGLSMVKQIARLHGGKVDVQSELGKGSKFIFAMPLK